MKKVLFSFVFAIIVVFVVPASANAAAKTIKKTVVEGKSCSVRTPAINRKISSVSVSKKNKKYLTAKRSKDKKSITLKGVRAKSSPVTVTVKVGKKKYKYRVTVAKAWTDSAAAPSKPVSPTVKKYVNNGNTCVCGGKWERVTFTDTYKPAFYYLGCVKQLEDDTPQTWYKEKESEDCYYPLRVSAVEAGYNYDRTYQNHRGYESSTDVALAMGAIPKTYNGVYVLQGDMYPLKTGVQWTTDRGGQVARMSVDNFEQTQVVDTGFWKCSKCGAIRQ